MSSGESIKCGMLAYETKTYGSCCDARRKGIYIVSLFFCVYCWVRGLFACWVTLEMFLLNFLTQCCCRTLNFLHQLVTMKTYDCVTKCLRVKMPTRRIFIKKVLVGFLSRRHFVTQAFCPAGILSSRHSVKQTFCLKGIFTSRHFVLQAFCLENFLSSRHFVAQSNIYIFTMT